MCCCCLKPQSRNPFSMFFPESRRKVHPEHESIVDPSNIHVNTDIVWHFFVVNTDLNAPRRRVFARRHGERTCVVCGDECSAATNPRSEHVGRAKPSPACLSSMTYASMSRRRLLLGVYVVLPSANRFCLRHPCVKSEVAEGELADECGSAASDYRRGVCQLFLAARME